MTMRNSDTSYEEFSQALSYYQDLYNVGIHCGDIEDTQVIKAERGKLTDYAFFQQTKCVGFAILNNNVVVNVYVIPENRKRGLFSAFLFFLKRNEGMHQIVLGDTQSEQTVSAVKRIYKRFNTFWIKDGEKIPYDPNTIDQFYSIAGPTGWQIMLENDGDFSHWPKFWSYISGGPPPLLQEFYYNLLDYEDPT